MSSSSSPNPSNNSRRSSSSSSDDDLEHGKPVLEYNEKGAMILEQVAAAKKGTSLQFLVWTVINTLATIGIVFTNKAIFSDPQLRLNQSSFASFHFAITAGTLYMFSKAPLSMFEPCRARLIDMLPLSLAMCLNVILPNLSLAYSTVTFYQIARVLLTPTVAIINFVFYGTIIPIRACYSLVPICLGVGAVTYFDTQAGTGSSVQTTTMAGVFFAFSGVLASSLYTVWIGSYQKSLGLNSMQLLLNSAPTSSFLLLYVIPFTDHAPVWSTVGMNKYTLIGLSGFFAALINISQFYIVAGAGPVSSTVVGHLKTCSIVTLGWMYSGRRATDKGVFGILVAITGIIGYSVIMYQHKQKSGLKA